MADKVTGRDDEGLMDALYTRDLRAINAVFGAAELALGTLDQIVEKDLLPYLKGEPGSYSQRIARLVMQEISLRARGTAGRCMEWAEGDE